jgi:glycosyltransferase involved in cell wall biosynthesis
MRMFIDGIKEIASLDMLFYVSPDMDVSPPSVSKLERSLSEYWDTNINLFLCPLRGFKKKGKMTKFWFYYGAGAFSFFKQSRFISFSGPDQKKAFEDCLSRKPDAIFAHKLYAMCPLMLSQKKLPPVYFDLDDIEHISFKRSINLLPRWYDKILNYIQLPMLLSGERGAIRLAHKTFVCSELDRDYLTKRWTLSGVTTIPNAVAIPERQSLTTDPTMLFIGSYTYKPNIDAAEFLINEVWPEIHKIMPEANLIIAGANPDKISCYSINIPGVNFTGFVDNLESLYEQVRIVCAPIFSGGGTRLKIIEAASFAKPVLATRIGAEGLDFQDGQELLLRNDSESFIEACLLLLRDYSLCEELGSAAYKKAVKLYNRNNILKLIRNCMKN